MSKVTAKCYNGKRTDKRMDRKYYGQMTKVEIDYLKDEFNKLKDVKACDHANDRLKEYDTTLDQLRKLLGRAKSYNIIEYNTGRGNERRVVIKDFTPIETKDGRYVNALYSIDIDRGEVITMWVNWVGDSHKTLDMSIYNANLKII